MLYVDVFVVYVCVGVWVDFLVVCEVVCVVVYGRCLGVV